MKVVNRRAIYDYQIFEKIEVGVVLTGAEVKSIKEGKISLDGSFARVKNGEVWLYNCHIYPYRFSQEKDLDPSRPRKVLLHKKEIISLEAKIKQKRLTLIPLSCYTKGRLIKFELALVKGKKEFEKKEKKKKEDLEREFMGMKSFDEKDL